MPIVPSLWATIKACGSLRIVARSWVWLNRRARSQVWAKVVRGDEFRYPVANHCLDALRGRSFQGVQRGAGCGAGAEGLDPVQDIGGELFDVDVLVDRRRRLIDDEVLEFGVVGKGCIGRDEGVGVGEGGLRPPADYGQRRHQASEHDEHGGQHRPTPSSRTTTRGRDILGRGWVHLQLGAQLLFSASSRARRSRRSSFWSVSISPLNSPARAGRRDHGRLDQGSSLATSRHRVGTRATVRRPRRPSCSDMNDLPTRSRGCRHAKSMKIGSSAIPPTVRRRTLLGRFPSSHMAARSSELAVRAARHG